MKKVIIVLYLFICLSEAFTQRNVILIIADDIGTDYFGFYEDHQDTVDVPNLRAMVNKGIRFQNAMSNPVCSSTRAGILTGRYSFRTGVGGIVGGAGGSGTLDTSEITIPRLLFTYNPFIAKANIGKWHLHQAMPVSNLVFPNVLGYNHFEGPFIGALQNYFNWTKYTNGIPGNVTNYATSENVNNAVSWIKSQKSNPFFLWLAFNAPHDPLHLPPTGLHNFNTLSGTQADINARPKEYYKAMIQALDHEIGRLFDSLKILNRFDSTDFIFIGDNGNTPRTSQITNRAHTKGTVYQYGVHVPFIISGPTVVNPGRASEALVNTADLFATITELFEYDNWQTQIPLNKPVDSKSILPIMKNQNSQIRPWSFCEIFSLTADSANGKAMRNLNYKLIKFDYGKEEFYHLASDPNEAVDLLTGRLNADEINNYNYLCNEMNALVGNASFCTISVGTKIVDNTFTNRLAYPNPFSSHIYISPRIGYEQIELKNSLGQIVFSGYQFEKHDFSNLAIGIYFLKILNNSNSVIKLIKR